MSLFWEGEYILEKKWGAFTDLFLFSKDVELKVMMIS